MGTEDDVETVTSSPVITIAGDASAWHVIWLLWETFTVDRRRLPEAVHV